MIRTESRKWWRRRSKKGKALIFGALCLGLVAVGLAAPPPEEERVRAEEEPSRAVEATTTALPGEPATKETASEATERSEATAGATRTFVVARVIDGDTIELENGKRVRLVQIDTPELDAQECYARRSRLTLARMLPSGTNVRLAPDPRLDKIDRYGRLLRYVFRGKENVNLLLVRRGAASVWFYEGDRGRYAAKLLSAARHAKARRRGLWRACAATRLDPLRAVTTASPPRGREHDLDESERSRSCDPNYSGACVPPYPPDVDCDHVDGRVTIVGHDPHRLDGDDDDGVGCER